MNSVIKSKVAAIAVTMLMASLLSSAAVNTAEAANGNRPKTPAPGAAVLTAQEQINGPREPGQPNVRET
jgi:hypothetical protein